jgi:hypothetical protein
MKICKTSALCASIALFGLGAHARATPVALQSVYVEAAAAYEGDSFYGGDVDNYTTYTGGETPAAINATDGTSTSTTTPEISDSTQEFDFNQFYCAYQSGTYGGGQTTFTANAGVNYAISGSATFSTWVQEGYYYASLFDESTNTYLYDYDVEDYYDGYPQTYTLDASGGPLTGTLTAGDTYEWTAELEADNIQEEEPTAIGSAAISFGASVPEPASLKFAMLLLPALGFWAWKQRNPMATAVLS